METNQIPTPQVVEQQCEPQQLHNSSTTAPQKKRKGLKIMLFTALALVVSAVGFYGYKNPNLFKAGITELVTYAPQPNTNTYLYIPDYNAGINDAGTIAVRTKNTGDAAFTSEYIVSMSFTLKYTPVDTISFNANSLVFETTGVDQTLFTQADLKNVDTSTPGEVKIAFFSNEVPPPQITAINDQAVVKLGVSLSGAAGGSVDLSVEDVEVIKANYAVGPPATVSNYAVSGTFNKIGAGQINFTTQNELQVVNAQALDSTHLLVRYSDYLQNVGLVGDYAITNPTAPLGVLAVASGYGDLTYPGYDQSTVILTTTAHLLNKEYNLAVTPGNVLGNTKGGLDTNYDEAYFKSYLNPDGVTNSAVSLDTVTVNSSTQLQLDFSGNLDPTTVTPINIGIKDVAGTALTVTGVAMDSSGNDKVNVTTASQTSNQNYFIVLDNVKDSGGLTLVNNIEKNFYGYFIATTDVQTITPTTVTNNTDQSVIAAGNNLDTVASVMVGTTTCTITQQSATSLTFTIPIGFTTGNYDVTFVNTAGQKSVLSDALLVNTPVVDMSINSDQSKAIPSKVNPDGKTEITFWVLVEDPQGIANIDSVTIDLQDIGGVRAQEMMKDTGLQQSGKQFYTFKSTVATTTPTKADPYKLPVEVKKGAQTASGTVDVYVTNDVLSSVAPTVDQVYVSPLSVPPDGTTKVKISAKVSDQDGADTIKSVVADLGVVGAGFVKLTAIDVAGTANEQITGWYESSEFTVPNTTTEGTYTITVSASDSTGETGTGTLSLNVSSSATGPQIDSTKSYLSPKNSIPKDGKTPFSINVMVSDVDGVSDVDSVIAYSSTLGIKPVSLIKDPNASDTSKTALFSSADSTIPSTTSVGFHEIEVIATDKSGGSSNLILRMEVTYKDISGSAPIIFSKKSYTTPKVALNDGITAITLYAFVRDDDDDLDSVVANLSNLGQVGQESLASLSSTSSSSSDSTSTDTSSAGTCPTGSSTMVCMTPSFKEGKDGQWFILPNVTVSTNTSASSTPYKVDIIATDKTSKVSRGSIEIMVRDASGYTVDSMAPAVVAAVGTAPGKVEVVFSEEMSVLSLSSNGSNFTITDKNDINKKLNVLSATINAKGNVVTLTTDSQIEDKDYALSVDGNITDSNGTSLSTSGKKAFFKGFSASAKAPVIHYVSALDSEIVEIGFQNDLKPSSINIGDKGDLGVKVYEADNPSSVLTVRSVQFGDSGDTLQVMTSPQKSATKYRIQISDITAAGGTTLESTTKTFKAINVSSLRRAAVANQADLNGDGKVDFLDFTMFSAVYGQVFGSEGVSSSPSAIPAKPDSTVPHTSEPAGGEVPSTTSSSTTTAPSTTTSDTTSTTSSTSTTSDTSTTGTTTPTATSTTDSDTTSTTSETTSTNN